jgi:chromosomal replication initiation ATPase DnaA
MGKANRLHAVFRMADTILHYHQIHKKRFASWAATQPDLFGKQSRRTMQNYLVVATYKDDLPQDITQVHQALTYIKENKLKPNTQNPAVLNLIDQFCKLYNCTWEQLCAKDRHAWVVECRYLLMYYLLTQYRLTNSLIARLFNKDHTTVLHGIRRIKDHMETDVNFREYVERMESLLDVNFTVDVEEVK